MGSFISPEKKVPVDTVEYTEAVPMEMSDEELTRWWNAELNRRSHSVNAIAAVPSSSKIKAEQSFLPSEKRFRGIITADKNTVIQSANAFIARLLGYSPHELENQPVEMIIPAPHKQNHRSYVEHFEQSGIGHVVNKPRQLEALHKCGALVSIFLTITPTDNPDSTTRYVALIEPAVDDVASITIDRAGKVLVANEATTNLFGFTQLELEGFQLSKILPEAVVSMIRSAIGEYYANGSAALLGHPRNALGQRRSGAVVPVSVVVDETAGAKRAEEGEAAFVVKLNAVDDLEASLTFERCGTLSSATAAAELLFGHSPLQGMQLDTLLPGALAALEAAGKEAVNDLKLTAKHSDDSTFDVVVDLHRMTEEQNNAYIKRVHVGVKPNEVTEIVNGTLVGRYKIDKLIGTGSSAKVYLARDADGEERAIKTVRLDWLDKYGGKDALQKLTREINVMKMCSHDNIARLYDVIETPEKMYLVLDYCDSGDLTEFWAGDGALDGGLPWKAAQQIFLELVSAIKHLHSRNIIHCDIKLDNIMLLKSGSSKLIDFGFAAVMEDRKKLTNFCGTPLYAAPEIFLNIPYGKPVDIWSAGVVLYILTVGLFPFSTPDQIVRGEFSFPYDANLPPLVRKLIEDMLSVSPGARPTIDEIAANQWLYEDWGKQTDDLQP